MISHYIGYKKLQYTTLGMFKTHKDTEQIYQKLIFCSNFLSK